MPSSPVLDASTKPVFFADRKFLDPMQTVKQMEVDIKQFRMRLRPAPEPAIGRTMPAFMLDEPSAKCSRLEKIDHEVSSLVLQK